MIVTAHIKFSIGTTFLDNFFTAEDERLPGESIEDGVLRVRKHLVNAIEMLKKEYPHLCQETDGIKFEFPPARSNPPVAPGGHAFVERSSIPVISKDTERLEIQIDNATSLEDLAKLKEQAGKQGLISPYMKKMNELLAQPKAFTDGLD